MTYRWVLVALFILEVIGRISEIGKPRAALTPKDCVVQVIVNSILIYGVFKWL